MDKIEKLKARLKRRAGSIQKHTDVLETVREKIESCNPKQKKYWLSMEERQVKKIKMSKAFWVMLRQELSSSQPPAAGLSLDGNS